MVLELEMTEKRCFNKLLPAGLALVILATQGLATATQATVAANKPNIVFIMVDDLGPEWIPRRRRLRPATSLCSLANLSPARSRLSGRPEPPPVSFRYSLLIRNKHPLPPVESLKTWRTSSLKSVSLTIGCKV